MSGEGVMGGGCEGVRGEGVRGGVHNNVVFLISQVS